MTTCARTVALSTTFGYDCADVGSTRLHLEELGAPVRAEGTDLVRFGVGSGSVTFLSDGRPPSEQFEVILRWRSRSALRRVLVSHDPDGYRIELIESS